MSTFCPYVEQSALYNQSNTSAIPPVTTVIPPYTAPLDFTTSDFVATQNFAANLRVFDSTGYNTSYAANFLATPTGYNNPSIARSFPDGTSNTILFATRYSNNSTVGSGGTEPAPATPPSA